MDMDIRKLEENFKKTLSDLQANMVLLKNSKKELRDSKTQYDKLSNDYAEIIEKLEDAIRDGESKKLELQKSYIKAKEDLEKTEKELMDSQEDTYAYMEKKLNGKLSEIRVEMEKTSKTQIDQENKYRLGFKKAEDEILKTEKLIIDESNKVYKILESLDELKQQLSNEVVRIDQSIEELFGKDEDLSLRNEMVKEETTRLERKIHQLFGVAIIVGIVSLGLVLFFYFGG